MSFKINYLRLLILILISAFVLLFISILLGAPELGASILYSSFAYLLFSKIFNFLKIEYLYRSFLMKIPKGYIRDLSFVMIDYFLLVFLVVSIVKVTLPAEEDQMGFLPMLAMIFLGGLVLSISVIGIKLLASKILKIEYFSKNIVEEISDTNVQKSEVTYGTEDVSSGDVSQVIKPSHVLLYNVIARFIILIILSIVTDYKIFSNREIETDSIYGFLHFYLSLSVAINFLYLLITRFNFIRKISLSIQIFKAQYWNSMFFMLLLNLISLFIIDSGLVANQKAMFDSGIGLLLPIYIGVIFHISYLFSSKILKIQKMSKIFLEIKVKSK